MFDGKRFFPETGIPMRKIDLIRTLLAVCEPDPFAVATCSEKSLTVRTSVFTCSLPIAFSRWWPPFPTNPPSR
jgi:hypothetical protein